jgi:NADP-dependent 3-hydroxy acid dehydrogenase YdfG
MDKESRILNIVITGASSGIGEATALEMSRSGHRFFLVGRNTDKLERVSKRVEELGGWAKFGSGDVGDEKDVERLFDNAVSELGTIDVLFANAGVGFFGNLEDLTPEHFDAQFRTNVKGVFLWIRKVLPTMKSRNSGQIIATSSNLGLATSARASVYSATKHAVQAMIWCLREELKGTQVKAATINPGSVSTPWFDGREVDRSRMLAAEDVARAVRFIIDQSETSNVDHILLLPGRI